MTNWIAVDWGTSRLRAWVMGADGLVAAELASEDGMAKLLPDQFEPVLLSLLDEHLPEDKNTPVICCGMVGARQGWVEADYIPVPCYPAIQQHGVIVEAKDPRLDVRILPGVKQTQPADVMRGEETQIAGYMKLHPDFTGVLCLPGTHTKWVQVSAQKIQSFSTCMTGELFALLSQKSVLQHSVIGDGWDQAAFIKSVQSTCADPAAIARQLFALRSEALLDSLSGATARARLSGMLIGLELAAEKNIWQNQAVVVMGASTLTDHYVVALDTIGVTAKRADGNQMTLQGLTAAYNLMMENDR